MTKWHLLDIYYQQTPSCSQNWGHRYSEWKFEGIRPNDAGRSKSGHDNDGGNWSISPHLHCQQSSSWNDKIGRWLAISDKIICVPISSSIRAIYDLCKQLGPLEQFFGDQSGPLIRWTDGDYVVIVMMASNTTEFYWGLSRWIYQVLHFYDICLYPMHYHLLWLFYSCKRNC